MNDRLHGVLSLALIGSGFLIGLLTVLTSSVLAALIDGFLLAAGSLLIVYAYCTKCPIRTSGCRHILPGRLTPMLPSRAAVAYTLADYLTVAFILCILIGYPQVWLLKTPEALLAFWILLALGMTEIILFVCNGCGNDRCVVCRFRNRSD